MNKNLIILAIAILLICVGLSGCTEENTKYYYYIDMELQSNWQVSNVDFQFIQSDSISNQSTGYFARGIQSLGNKSLGNGSVYRYSPEFNFHMDVGIYNRSSPKDSEGFYVESYALKIHKSDWTLTSKNNHIKFIISVNETGDISIDWRY